MEQLLDFWNANSTVITNFIWSFGATLVTFLINKIGKKVGNRVIEFSTSIVTILFGGEVDNVQLSSQFKELPFVKEVREYARDIGINFEIQLIELKRKLLSPKLSEIERITYQFEYNKLLTILGKKISPETAQLLIELENMPKE